MTLSNAITEFIKGIRASKSKATADAYQSDLRRMSKHAKIDTVVQNAVGIGLYTDLGFREVARQVHFAMKL